MCLFHVSADESKDDLGCLAVSIRFCKGGKEVFV